MHYFTSLEMSEQEKLIAELGKPRLGERNLIRIRIRESKEFKVKTKIFIQDKKKAKILHCLNKECRR